MPEKKLADNKKARFNYDIIDSIECGIELKGTEVKSIKSGRFSFSDSYGRIQNNELWLISFHVSEYPFGTHENHQPDRPRKLLLHKQELKKLKRQTEERGMALVPLKVYVRNGLVKIEIALGKGKKKYDKRDAIKKRDQKREAERELKNY